MFIFHLHRIIAAASGKVPLRAILIIPFVLQIVGAVGLVGYLSFRTGQTAVEDLAQQLMDEVGDRVQLRLDTYLATPHLVNRLNADAWRSGHLAGFAPQDPVSIEPYFWQQIQQFETISFIAMGNQQGGAIGAGRLEDGTLITFRTQNFEQGNLKAYRADRHSTRTGRSQDIKGQSEYDVRKIVWYQAAVEAKTATWSPIYQLVGNPPRLGITATLPVYDLQGNLQGVMAANFFVLEIDRFLKTLRQDYPGEVFIIERDGALVGTSFESVPVIDEEGYLERVNAFDSDRPLMNRATGVLRDRTKDLHQIKTKQQFDFTLNNNHYFLQAFPFQDRYGLDWLVVEVVPKAEFMAQIHANTRTTLLLSLTALIGAMTMGIFTAQWISQPILRLNAAAKKIAAGDLEGLVRMKRTDEIGELAQSFNVMAQQLQASFDQVKLALQESEEKFTKLFRSSPDAISIATSPDARFLDVNDSFCQSTGYSREELIGRTAFELGFRLEPVELLKLSQLLSRDRVARNLELAFPAKSGEKRIALTSLELLDIDGQPHVIAISKDITERKHADEALQESEARYRRIIETATEGIWQIDADSKTTFANQHMAEMLGYTPEEMLGKSLFEFMNEDGKASAARKIERRRQGISEQHDFKFQRKDGSDLWAIVSTQPIQDETGQYLGALGMVTDITERKQAEDNLRKSEATLTQAQRIGNIGSWEFDRATQQLRWSEEMFCIFGLKPSPFGPAIEDHPQLFHPEDWPKVENALSQLLNAGPPQQFEYRILRPDGSIRYLEGRGESLKDAQGQVLKLVGTALDITEWKQANIALRQSEARYRAVVEDQTEFINRFLPDGTITFTNDACCRYFGIAKAELLGRSFFSMLTSVAQQTLTQALASLTPENPVYLHEQYHQLQTEEWRWQQWCNRAIFNDQGELIEFQAVGRDITERKQAEMDLAKAKDAAEAANRAKSEFLANMSHEIRTPMNGVLGTADLLLRTPLDSEQKDLVQTLTSSANSLLVLLNDILDFSKLEAGKIQLEQVDFNLQDCLQSVIDLLVPQATEKGLKLSTSLHPNIPLILRGDPTRLRQILINLVGNAIKFTHTGEVGVTIENLTLHPKTALSAPIHLRFKVRDTGIGIAPENQTKLFQKFSQADASMTRRYGGTGLGLAICQQLVTLMAGEIGVSSQLGKGTTFWFTVPFEVQPVNRTHLSPQSKSAIAAYQVCSGQFPPVPNRQTSNERKLSRLKILVVDDARVNQKVVLRQLQQLGHTGDCVNNGQEALEKLATSNYDIVLMDCQMPVLDGYQATQAIRQQEQGTDYHQIVIGLTAHAMKGDREKCLAAGMDNYMTKPLILSELERILQQVKPGNLK